MSGICGLFQLNGQAPEPGQIEAMTIPLQTRGPDGSYHCPDGAVALGHTAGHRVLSHCAGLPRRPAELLLTRLPMGARNSPICAWILTRRCG
jgi:hypothetical protein